LVEIKSKLLDNLDSLIDTSIVIPCKNEFSTLKPTVDSILQSKNTTSFEIIVVDDASKDNSSAFLESGEDKKLYERVLLLKTNNLGAAGARNAGAGIAKGKHLFFCDAHVEVPDGWLDSLVDTLKQSEYHIVAPCILDMNNPLAAGYGQTWDKLLNITWLLEEPYGISEIPIACGCAFGITREAFDIMGGFHPLFQVWGKEDEELCFRAWLYGFKSIINPAVKVKHLFRKSHPYKISYDNVTYNFLCMAYSHFNLKRLEKSIQISKHRPGFSYAASQIRQNYDLILQYRNKCLRERKHDDNFFFEKFNIPF
jgi:glycosyltransferase involved in cell wall biosynthesis